jgi:hypothetical protein
MSGKRFKRANFKSLNSSLAAKGKNWTNTFFVSVIWIHILIANIRKEHGEREGNCTLAFYTINLKKKRLIAVNINLFITRTVFSLQLRLLKTLWFFLWGNLKDKVYSNNPHTLVELKQSIRETISSIEGSELKLVSNNIFKRLEACLRAEGRHFEHLLWW